MYYWILKRKYPLLLVGISLFGVVSHFYFGLGIDLYDPAYYFKHAWEIANGTFEINGSVFWNRFGMLVPLSLLIKLFGISYWAALLWPLLCYLLLLFGIYRLLYSYSAPAAFFCAALVGLSYTFIWFNALIMPDTIMTGFAFLAMLLLWKMNHKPANEARNGLLFSLLLFAAFVTKLTIIFLLPFILFVWFQNFRDKKLTRFWIWAAGPGVLILLLYHLGYQIFADDFLLRYSGIENDHNVSEWSYYTASTQEIIERITYAPILLLFSDLTFSLPLLLAVPSLRLRVRQFHRLEVFFTILLFILMVLYWWGSSSFKSYNPIPINYRMWLLLIIPLNVLAALTLFRFGQWQAQKKQLVLWLSAGLAFVVAALVSGYDSILLLTIVCGCIAATHLPVFQPYRQYLPAIVILLPAIYMAFQYWQHPRSERVYFFEKEFYNEIKTEDNVLILTDHTYNVHEIYFDFKTPKNVHIDSWFNLETLDLNKYNEFYILFSNYRHTRFSRQFPGYDIPRWLHLLMQEQKGEQKGEKVTIYKIDRETLQHYRNI